MEPELKQKWIDALESGKYIQEPWSYRGYHDTFVPEFRSSRNDNMMSTLAILCDIVAPEGWWICQEGGGWGRSDVVWFARNNVHRLGDKLRQEVGLRLGDESHIIFMETWGSSFEEIAQYIRENV